MTFVLRLDLCYRPWDEDLAAEWGHASVASVLVWLERARKTGYQYHFFVSREAARALPSLVEAIEAEGHPVDALLMEDGEEGGWLVSSVGACWATARPGAAPDAGAPSLRAALHPAPVRSPELDSPAGRSPSPQGEGGRGPGPTGNPGRLLCLPEAVLNNPIGPELRGGKSLNAYGVGLKEAIRRAAGRQEDCVVALEVEPLAHADPKGKWLEEICEWALKVGYRMRTLREA